ncbi:EAL domain-containing protein [Neobacillus mesonae]|uniref:EAL domain-containing protein n=1 Tax=Neobacillus mesonae TaxID=1193713 RepID=UPI0020407D95|nr:EAL domain-containing protein [Neobacillus mesonae]MCM3570908.1 EAL domain-containing protein [Neobacillus mesonae]
MDHPKPFKSFSDIKNSQVYSYLMYLNTRRRNAIDYYKSLKELQSIMKHHSLNTFFQSILKLTSGETVGYEILNRSSTTKVFTNTETFYDFVGQSNQVFSFEGFCRNISLKRFIERHKENIQEKSTLIFINIHPHVLLDTNYHSGETYQLLSDLGIEPTQVVFELTEKSAVTDFPLFEKVLSNYRSRGFRIAIDDAGSGYNSLKTFIYLKPEFIKLYWSLFQNIDKNIEQQQLVKLKIEYAKQSSTEMIAEGIERLEELAFICEHGVDFVKDML